MKVFAILTACLMASGTAAYFLDSSAPKECQAPKDSPAAKPDCCSADAAKPSCCAAAAKADCCSAGGPDCCGPNAPCCEAGLACCATGACCDGAKTAVAAKAKAKPDCCEAGGACRGDAHTAAKLGATAAMAGVGAK